ncbi:MAG: histidine phosphotransferase family protein [Sphingomonadales bacterium]
MGDIDLAALLCSRLCHDLVSPVGAISNGAEILDEDVDEDMRRQAVKLMSHSAHQAALRLQFFRMAFGTAGVSTQPAGVLEAHKVASRFFEDGKVTLQWELPRLVLTRNAVKLLLNMILVGGEALVRGGGLKVTVEQVRGGVRLTVAATGAGVKLHENIDALLNGSVHDSELETRTAPAKLAGDLAREMGATLVAEKYGDNQVLLLAQVGK